MKKLLLAIFSLVSVATYAQKDLEVILALPDSGQTIENGKPFDIVIGFKNVGMDVIPTTDTIFFQVILNNQALSFNGSNVFSVTRTSDLLKDSVSAIVMQNVGLTFSAENPTAQFCIAAAMRSNGAAVTETSTANNADCNQVALSWPTAINEIEAAANTVKVYPNPVSDVLNITIDYNKAATVNVLDITGRLVETVSIENGAAKVQVGGLGHGIYMYQIMSKEGKNIKTGKFTVNN